MADVLGIYVHIPFCRSKCDYCDFYSLSGRESDMDTYCKTVIAQIKQRAPSLAHYQVDSIYFGGGTPSYFGEQRLRNVLTALRRGFSLSKSAEITLECNPDSVDLKSLGRLHKAGFNRISLGMQSADPCQLQDLHRPHSVEDVAQAVQWAREAKFDNLSLDLIYGLPQQNMESWQATLDAAIALQPEHISAYGLKVEAGTALAKRDKLEDILPDDDMQADMYLYLSERLPQAGYRQYEISNFAKTGKESRHNLKYWMGRDFIGFGPGAHSSIGGKRSAYARDLSAYLTAENVEDLCETLETSSLQERARDYLIFRLRTLRGIEEWEYRREFYMNFEPLQHKMEFYERHGWATQSGRRWHFTPEGFLRSNTLINDLLDCQGEAPSIPPAQRFPCRSEPAPAKKSFSLPPLPRLKKWKK